MNGAFFATGTIRPLGLDLKRWLGLWLVAEAVAFLVVVKLIGAGMALLLMLMSSVVGVVVLRRVGLGAARHLRRHIADGGTANEAFVDGSLTALGALLLILPGFVSDVVGLALATPSVRQQLAARFLKASPNRPAQAPHRSRQDVIDLGPEDWRVVDRTPGGSTSTRP